MAVQTKTKAWLAEPRHNTLAECRLAALLASELRCVSVLFELLRLPIEQRIAPLFRIRQALARDYGIPFDKRIARLITSSRKRMVGGFYAYDNHTEIRDLGTEVDPRAAALL